jgi:3-hydroxyacyl-[acyl-carrier-protein] dehydratase
MLDTPAIWKRLPHRYPFLLVDRITLQEPERVAGYKNVTINEPFFTGHFPAPLEAVMPGVLILEAMTQVAAFLVLGEGSDIVGYLAGVDKARFRRKVRPGDRLDLDARLVRRKADLVRAEVVASVEGEMAASAIISIVLRAGGSNAIT